MKLIIFIKNHPKIRCDYGRFRPAADRDDPKVKNLRNTKFRAILIDILHFHNPQTTSCLYKLFLSIFDIIYNPTDHF